MLLAKCTAAMLAELKVGDSARLAAFVKRLSSCALHANPAVALAELSVVNKCAHIGLHNPNLQICGCVAAA